MTNLGSFNINGFSVNFSNDIRFSMNVTKNKLIEKQNYILPDIYSKLICNLPRKGVEINKFYENYLPGATFLLLRSPHNDISTSKASL